MKRFLKEILPYFLSCVIMINAFGSLAYAQAYEEEKIEIQLTEEEKEYIDLQKEIRLAFLVTRPPISFSDNGNISGIDYDIMKRIQEITSLNFTYMQLPEGTNPVEYVTDGNADIAVGVFNYGANLTNQNVILTDIFFSSDIGLVAKKGASIDMSNRLKVLVNKGYYMGYQFLKDSFPYYDIEYAPDVESSLKAVQQGKADLAFQNVYVMNEYLKRPSYNDLLLFKSSLAQEKLTCAVSVREDKILVDIINKAIAQISEEYKRQLIVDYTITRMYYPSLSEYVRNNPALFGSLFMVVVILLVAATLFFKLKARNQYIQKEKILKEALEDEKEMYRIFTEDSKDIVFYIDWVTKKFHWPEYWKSRFGYIPPEKIDIDAGYSPLTTVIANESIPELQRLVKTLKDGQNDVEENVRIRCANGVYKWHKLQVKRMMKNDTLYRLLGKLTDIDSEILRIQQLSDASMRDKLTGLYNKDAFYMLVNETINQNNVHGVLMFLDLDNFKSVNDQMGHLAGDEILVNVAKSMSGIFRSDDVIARFGGDEFVIYAVE